jgi:hypothetical protein
MDRAERLMTLNPDSAKALLDEVEFMMFRDKDIARWALLSGKVEDEIRKTQKSTAWLSTNQWKRAWSYYEKRGTPEEQATILYYYGRSLYRDGNLNEAADEYLKGLEIARQANLYSTAGYICSYQAELYVDKEMVDEAAEKYGEAAEFHRKAGNVRSQALALADLSFCYRMEEKQEDALRILQQADSMLVTIGDDISRSAIKNGRALVYEDMLKYDSAEYFYLKSLELDTSEQNIIFYNLSLLYSKKGDVEKSNYYMEKSSPYLDGFMVSYQRYLLEKSKDNFEPALSNLEQFVEMQDSIRMEQNKNQVLEIEKKYDKAQVINERNQLEIYFQTLLMVSLLLFIAYLALFWLYRQWQNRRIREKQNEIFRLESKYDQLEAELEKKYSASGGGDQSSEEYGAQIRELENLKTTLFDGKLELLKQSPAGKKIQKLSTGNITQNRPLNKRDWEALENLVIKFFPKLYSLITGVIPRSSADLFRLCLLSFFELPTKTEAIVMGEKDEIIRQNRTRLRKKFQMENSPDILLFFRNRDESF